MPGMNSGRVLITVSKEKRINSLEGDEIVPDEGGARMIGSDEQRCAVNGNSDIKHRAHKMNKKKKWWSSKKEGKKEQGRNGRGRQAEFTKYVVSDPNQQGLDV